MKVVAYGLAVVLGGLGVVFIAGNQGVVLRIVVGVVLMVSALALVALVRLRPVERTVVQRVDLSGDVSLEHLTCKECRGTLGDESVQVKAGAVFVRCQYCGATYQLEEAPKW